MADPKIPAVAEAFQVYSGLSFLVVDKSTLTEVHFDVLLLSSGLLLSQECGWNPVCLAHWRQEHCL